MSSYSSRPRIQNIVSTINLDCKLDLKTIAMQAPNTEYDPKRFVAVIMRIKNLEQPHFYLIAVKWFAQVLKMKTKAGLLHEMISFLRRNDIFIINDIILSLIIILN